MIYTMYTKKDTINKGGNQIKRETEHEEVRILQ